MLDRPRADQYFVVTRIHGRPPLWTWEIQRRPTALGSWSAVLTSKRSPKPSSLVKALWRFSWPRQGRNGMRDPMHCDERMELARLIPSFQISPELLVFRCPPLRTRQEDNRSSRVT